MKKTFFFDADTSGGAADITYSASDFASLCASVFSRGVLSPSSFTPVRGLNTLMMFSPGAACIDGYIYLSTEQTNVQVAPASHGKFRKDTYVLRLNTESRTSSICSIMGDESVDVSSLTPPDPICTDTVKDLVLASATVSGANGIISDSAVTDMRIFSSMKNSRITMETEMAELSPLLLHLTSDRENVLESVADRFRTDGVVNALLCGDGSYRTPANPTRVLLCEFSSSGDYTFNTADYPSVNGLYDFEMIGGGGAGGAYGKLDSRGGGGGAGCYINVHNMPLLKASYTVTVGAGGVGQPESSGGDGTPTSFAGFTAVGGHGGGGGTHGQRISSVSGGEGGARGGFCGEYGCDGVIGNAQTDFTLYASGASSVFGSGGRSSAGSTSMGQNASGAGAGGSGGGCMSSSFSASGGCGGDGLVRIYGYVPFSMWDE